MFNSQIWIIRLVLINSYCSLQLVEQLLDLITYIKHPVRVHVYEF